MKRSISLGMVTAVSAFALGLALMPGVARAAEDKTYVMKISLPTLNDSTHQFAKNYAAALERGRSHRNRPPTQLGSIPRQIEAHADGSIQACAILRRQSSSSASIVASRSWQRRSRVDSMELTHSVLPPILRSGR